MSGPGDALKTALETVLRSDAGVTAQLGVPLRIFPERSHQAGYPHASWGRAQVRDRGASGVLLLDYRQTLDIWLRDGVALDLVDAVRVALTGVKPELAAPWRLVSLAPAYADLFTTTHSRVRRGLVRVHALIARDD
ncbi:tail completion protein gp17 [Maricaulis parjimensis]|uniref:tail completion protein gp17 n=1 Tax=Maricaulis parjimensis TaxID=144023 RepID=UPI00193ACB78